MRTAAMSRSKVSGADVHDDNVLYKQRLHVLRVRPGVARLIKIWFGQEADGVCHAVGLRAMLEALSHTPPR